MNDKELLLERLERLAIVLDELMPQCAELVRDSIVLLKEQEPKHGKWVKQLSSCPSAIAVGGSRTSACTICGGWGRKTFKYCPHCGAKMEGW